MIHLIECDNPLTLRADSHKYAANSNSDRSYRNRIRIFLQRIEWYGIRNTNLRSRVEFQFELIPAGFVVLLMGVF
jgi:hypothetical protein